MVRRIVGILFTCWWLIALAAGQAPAAPQRQPDAQIKPAQAGTNKQVSLHLTRVDTVNVPSVVANSFYPPFECDADGNIYFQNDPRAPAIQKFNSKGEPVALFRAAPNTEKKIDHSGSFAVTPSGDLFELVFPHEINRYVFSYKSDGAFKSTIKLDPGFPWMPHRLAVFPSGQMLITGSEYDQDRSAAMWPFTGIFAADGSLLKEVKLEDDETLHDMAAAGDARVSVPGIPQSNRALANSHIEMAADGNGYLMRWTNPAIIYAISPGGEVVRRLKVDPGESNYQPGTMHVFQNRIAVLFIEPNTYEKIMKIVDLEGHEIATYNELRANGRPQAFLTGAFYCYTENPKRFIFLGASDDSKLQFWIVEPR
jgi:hypothetical protein